MPNLVPRARRGASPLAPCTEPEPSMSRCRLGSTRRAKILSGGAGITRSTDTTSVMVTFLLPWTRHGRDHAPWGHRRGGQLQLGEGARLLRARHQDAVTRVGLLDEVVDPGL